MKDYGTNKLEQLLKEISRIVLKDKVQQEEKRKRGEYFNIFSVIGVQRKEVRLHSAFIAELLNPQGSHGLGDRFLIAFLENTLGKKNYSIETKTTNVVVEYVIGPISEDGKRGGRIDILLTDKKNNTIIIENKIDANDQENQLLRYYNYAKDKKLSYDLIYLTKEGNNASDFSTNGENVDYRCISYRYNIISWLEYCEKIANKYPSIRETIHQYIINLKEILNIMDNTNEKALLDVMLEKDNAYVISDILNRQYEWQFKLLDKYIWSPLENYLKNIDSGIELKPCNEGRCIKIKNWESYSIVIGSDRRDDWNNMYIGIKSEQETKDHFEKFTCFNEEPTNLWPYGWSYLPSDLGNWSDAESRNNIIDGKVLDFLNEIIDKIIEEFRHKII